jgi:hypothetical protein
MKRVLIILLFVNFSLFIFSCGDPSKRAGEDAARQYNENTNSTSEGGGTTGNVMPKADTLNRDSSDNDEDEQVRGSGSAPAD